MSEPNWIEVLRDAVAPAQLVYEVHPAVTFNGPSYFVGWGIDLTETEEIFEVDEVPDLATARAKLREMLVAFDPAGCDDCAQHQREALVDLANWDGVGQLTVEVDGYEYGIWLGPDRNNPT